MSLTTALNVKIPTSRSNTCCDELEYELSPATHSRNHHSRRSSYYLSVEDSGSEGRRSFDLIGLWRLDPNARPFTNLGTMLLAHYRFSKLDGIYQRNAERLNRIPTHLSESHIDYLGGMVIYSEEDLYLLWETVGRIALVTSIAKVNVSRQAENCDETLALVTRMVKEKRDFYAHFSRSCQFSECARRDSINRSAVLCQLAEELKAHEVAPLILSSFDIHRRLCTITHNVIGSVSCDAVFEVARSVLEICDVPLE